MTGDAAADEAADERTFDARINAAMPRLSPSEQRVARFFLDRREVLVLSTAVEIGVLAGTSDATVVRAARSLGFSGLAELRELALADIAGSAASPGGRLAGTLDQAGASSVGAIRHVVAAHQDGLAVLQTPTFEDAFDEAVAALSAARRIHVFGIGPSGAMANFAVLQLNRIGRPAAAMTASGVALADGLLALGHGDAVLMLAYAPLYREVAVTLDHAERLGAPVVLVSDSLASFVEGKVKTVLPVPRGRAGNLAMHGATLVTIEALVTALAAGARDEAISTLEELSALRGAIDRDWLKRGVLRKSGRK